ncbi:hypothetical protein JL720_2540 [Aureococcus anophagefferens]|nr:hypothetical protein JL720_2540 [Aureococcus anophagefferens]
MLAAWDSMVAAVAEEEDHEGLLAKPFADAGAGDGGAAIAERTWVEAGATSLDHAKSIQKQRLYREWGVASVRGRADQDRPGLIGAPSSIPRPDYGRDAAAKRARDAAYARAARGTGGTFGVAYGEPPSSSCPLRRRARVRAALVVSSRTLYAPFAVLSPFGPSLRRG